jgi:hypothetical protein
MAFYKNITRIAIGQRNWTLLHGIQFARTVCHIAFLRTCKMERLVPKGLRCSDKLSNTFPSDESKELSERHSRHFLNLLIQTLYGNLRRMGEHNFKGPLTRDDSIVLNKVRAECVALKVKKLTTLKMERHMQNGFPQYEPSVMQHCDAFTNLSSVEFDQDELDLLHKGPSFAPPCRITDRERIKLEAQIDHAVNRLPIHIPKHCISEFTGVAKRIISEKESNVERHAMKTLESIKGHEVVITHSDKSKKLIAVNPLEYSQMKQDHVSNLKEVPLIQPTTVQAKFNSALHTIAKKYPGDLGKTISGFACSEPLPSKMKILPKDHKEGRLKGRPIIAATDAPARRLSQFLSKQLMGLVILHVPSYIGSTSDFIGTIKNFEMSSNFCFASLDVVNLYGSIPLNDNDFSGALSVVTKFFEQHKEDCDIHAIDAADFRTLLSLSVTSDLVQVENKVYKIQHGVQMGNSVSCAVAIIFMNYIESQILAHFGSRIKLLRRYIDDFFLIYEDINEEELLQFCNDVHPDLSFTMEHPCGGEIAFLDLLLHLNGNRFAYSLYAKDSRSAHVIPWSSHHPRSFLRNIIRNEMKRAINNGSGPSEKARGIKLMEQRYRSNGYPHKVIRKAISEARRPSIPKEAGYRKIYLSLPYRSERGVREIRQCLRKTSLNDFVCVNFISRPLHRILLRNGESQCLNKECVWCQREEGKCSCMTKFCVYLIRCRASPNCSAEYVGETQRTMRARLREHVTVNTSHVQRHLLAMHGNANIEQLSWKVLHRGLQNFTIRRKIEAHEIALRRPLLNVQQR